MLWENERLNLMPTPRTTFPVAEGVGIFVGIVAWDHPLGRTSGHCQSRTDRRSLFPWSGSAFAAGAHGTSTSRAEVQNDNCNKKARQNRGLFYCVHRHSVSLHSVTQAPNTCNRHGNGRSLQWRRCFSVPRWQCLTLPDPSPNDGTFNPAPDWCGIFFPRSKTLLLVCFGDASRFQRVIP